MKDNKLAATHEQPVKNGACPYEISFFSIFTFVLDIQPSRSAMARLPCMQQGEVQGELRHLHEIPGNHFPDNPGRLQELSATRSLN
ncbi:hypothetical protein [Pseudomonas aeruginosa]|uniref:hypothetical protein n=1 Tax=Pseudomonas aeruginosa TaxID=287 RepID=UPI0035C0A29A